jgi:hypothetical protein
LELFLGSGRGVVALPVTPTPGRTQLYIDSIEGEEAVVVSSASAWEMGCGWAQYP